MSYDICGKEWLGKDGKDHRCVHPAHDVTLRCTCDCGDKIPSTKRLPLKLAKWKRGKKIVTA